MTRATTTAGAAPHGEHRLNRRGVPTLSACVSVVLHALALALCTLVVYESAFAPRQAASEVEVSFDEPGMSTAMPAAGAASAAAGSAALTGRGEIALVATPAGAMEGFGPGPADSALAPIIGLANAQLLSALMSMQNARSGGPGSAFDGTLAGSSGAFVSHASMGDAPAGVTFAGLGAATARSVVYAVDCSGPMVTSLPMVLAEVRRSASRLAPTQKFGVVLFSSRDGSPAIESFAPLLVRATPSALTRLDTWLSEAEPAGKSCPLAGLEAAISFKPDAVFLLSRSIERSGGGVWEQGLQPTLAKLEALNPAIGGNKRAVLIQTIQFIDDDPTGIMQAIAIAHGGGTKGYRVIKRGEEIAP